MQAGDIWELRLDQFMTGPFQNRHCFLVVNPVASWHALTYAQWVAGCRASFIARHAGAWDFQDATWHEIVPGTAADVATGEGGASGPISGNAWPSQNAAKILWRTGVPGKSFKGSSFFGGYSAVDQVDSSISNALGTVLNSYGAAMIARFGPAGSFAATAQFGILSRQHDNMPVDPPILTVVNSFSVRDTIRVQRRRRDA